jgi:hypothetical protein
MPTIICAACAKPFFLDPVAYWNYAGDVRCTNCGAFLTNVVFQAGELKATPIHKTLSLQRIAGAPGGLMEDLIGAQVCHAVGAYKASIVMCRRALEQFCLDKRASGRTLRDKLQFLASQGVLSSEVVDLANEIRYFGNYGAHPENDLLTGITGEESGQVLELCLHMARHTYEMQQTLQRLRAKRKGSVK